MKKIMTILIGLVILGLVMSSFSVALKQKEIYINKLDGELKEHDLSFKQFKLKAQEIKFEKTETSSVKNDFKMKRISDSDVAFNKGVSDLLQDEHIETRHPTLAFEPVGNYATLAFDLTNSSDPTTPYPVWCGSNDDGENFLGGFFWVNSTTDIVIDLKYPDIDWWGYEASEPKFVCSAVGEGLDDGIVMFTEVIGDPTLVESWSSRYVDWSFLGYTNFRMSRIAGSDASNPWEWGIIALVNDIPGEGKVGVCSWMYADPEDENSVAMFSWQTPHNSSTADSAIDPVAGEFGNDGYPYYVIHDGPQSYEGINDTISFAKGYFGDMADLDSLHGFYGYFSPDIRIREPTVEVYDDKCLVATELWFQNDTTFLWDKDVVVWHYNYSNPDANVWDEISTGTYPDFDIECVGGTVYDEEHPTIQHIYDETFIVTFTLNNSLWFSITTDAGVTWSDVQKLSASDFGEPVCSEYKNADLGELEIDDGTMYCAWEFEYGSDILIAERGIWTPVCPCQGGCGDYNCDGGIDIDDVVGIILHIFSGGYPPSGCDLCCGDANGSGDVDIDDVVYLINYIFGGGPAPCGCCYNLCGACE